MSVLPVLTEADPLTTAEGSLDPLGLALVADRLAESLLPSVRARMQRIKFITASAVGAVITQDLHEIPPKDRISTPSICFEWLVLEAFVKTSATSGQFETLGIPGSGKTWAVHRRGETLSAVNYLKSPSVFGFTGVYLPLARELGVLDVNRRPGPRAVELVRAWEADNLDLIGGFTDMTKGSRGAKLRDQVRDEVSKSLYAGHCTLKSSSHLGHHLTRLLHPDRMGKQERKVLRNWLLNGASPSRSQVASLVSALNENDEPSLLNRLLTSNTSKELKDRLRAIQKFENFANVLDSAFRSILWQSTISGLRPVTNKEFATNKVVLETHRRLEKAYDTALRAISQIENGPASRFDERLGRFGHISSPAQFVEVLLTHHLEIQARKPPRGKRPWLDEAGRGWIVRRDYQVADEVVLDTERFLHPYRLLSMQSFMQDTAP